MRFLLDSNLSHRVAQLLRDAGIDATHVRDNDLQHATDSVILEFARQHAFVLVSEDTDFGELLARQCTVAPSFVLLRTYEPLTPDEQAAVLLANLPRLHDDLAQGAIVVIERSRLRVRCLPVLPPIPEQREQ
jgi:predicted nuclease of predicted toxin-antitoxin system